MKKLCLIILSSFTCLSMHSWSGNSETKNANVIYSGILTSHENNTFSVINISIGRSRDSNQKIVLYEKPEKPVGSSAKINLTRNPFKDLTTSELDLSKISALEVPEPNVSWLWRQPSDDKRSSLSMAHEFIEIVITWRTNQRSSYLLELGLENSTTPVKLFCDTIDQTIAPQASDNALFCVGVKKADLIKKGAPFPAIKKLELREPCYDLPANATPINK